MTRRTKKQTKQTRKKKMTKKTNDGMKDNLMTRSASLVRTDESARADGENMTLSFSFSSESPVERYDFWTDERWIEVLGHGDAEVDLSRLNSGAPVLLNHSIDASRINSVGVTTGARIENGRGIVDVKMSRRADVSGILTDIKDGILPNVSVGYRILERTLVKESPGGPPTYRVTKWEPLEVTLADVPADATVGIGRNLNLDEVTMTTKKPEAADAEHDGGTIENRAAPALETIDTKALRAEATGAERKRINDIITLSRTLDLGQEFCDKSIEDGLSIDAARAIAIERIAEKQGKPSVPPIETLRDETETRNLLIENALLHRASSSFKLEDGARSYMGYSLTEIARSILESEGVNTRGMDKLQLAGAAFNGSRSMMGTSDFVNILSNIANKFLRKGYEAAPRTFTSWARQESINDFREVTRAQLSDGPKLEKVNEGGEFKRGTLTDGAESYRLVTVGKILAITRQAIINDDLQAFTRIPQIFSASGAQSESDAVYDIITSNALMADGKGIFHADHKNLTSTGTVISQTSLGVARAMMRKQTAPQGTVLNLSPAILLVPAALETVANNMVSNNYVAATQADQNQFGGLRVVVEPRLDIANDKSWYLIAESSMIDTVEYAYLSGNSGVYLESRVGFDVDGVELKARLDFGAKAIDYRGMYKNVGA
jgi:phage head maturation protease